MAKQKKRINYWLIVLALFIAVYLLYSLLLNNPLVIPEAGYCIEKNLETEYTTMINNNGTKETIEFCPLKSFCETHYESTIVMGGAEEFDQEALDNFASEQESKGLECFQDIAYHTQRDTDLFKTNTEYLRSKFVCCTNNNLEADNCPGNTCEGRYMGFLDNNHCRVYANEIGYNEEGIMRITTCGGDASQIIYEINDNNLTTG